MSLADQRHLRCTEGSVPNVLSNLINIKEVAAMGGRRVGAPKREREKGGFGRRIVDMLELPREIVFNLPIIQATGNEEISISNYKGLMEFNGEHVRINTGAGVIRLEGTRLALKHITVESITIAGKIKNIEFIQ